MEKQDIKSGALFFENRKEARAEHRNATISGVRLNNLVVETYPLASGDFEIDNYLKNLSPRQACWVDGDTVYGDIYIGDQNWGTYSRPVFAYLDYVDRYPVPTGSNIEHTFTKRKGFTQTFTESVNVKYSVGAAIDIVNASSEISVGFEASQAWSSEVEESWTTTLQGPATFYTYQIVLVYAHRATSAANKFPNAFKYNKKSTLIGGWRTDLFYLSAINKNDLITVTSPVAPLTWNQVQQYVLFDHWNNWYFDYNAYHDNRY